MLSKEKFTSGAYECLVKNWFWDQWPVFKTTVLECMYTADLLRDTKTTRNNKYNLEKEINGKNNDQDGTAQYAGKVTSGSYDYRLYPVFWRNFSIFWSLWYNIMSGCLSIPVQKST